MWKSILWSILQFSLVILTVGEKLDDYIQHYEKLQYNTDMLHQRHLRAKRSLKKETVSLKFKAFDRDFSLNLKHSDAVFSTDFHHEHSNGTRHVPDISFIYEGNVEGEPDSFVHGGIIDGVFRGFIAMPDDMYYVEHSRRFFKSRQPFHSVIYKREHVDLDPYRALKDMVTHSSCALDKHYEEMVKIQHSATNLYKTPKYEETEGYHNPYTREINVEPEQRAKKRSRRAVKLQGNLGAKNTCYLYLRSDPILFNYYKDGVTASVAEREIILLFTAHVAAINSIYGRTKFETYSGDMYVEGIHFLVQRTTIMTEETEKCSSITPSAFCDPNIDVSNFLNLNSLQNHDEFCLAYVFTARDFTKGTLGLAWVGSTGSGAGGVCEKFKMFDESGGKKVGKSLNTGIVTIINYGKEVAPIVSHLTFAHEVGHNFGSPHDSGSVCAPYPGDPKGNYIMYASATQGELEHNSQFSPCSKDNITRVLDAVIYQRNGKVNCFNESDKAFCGNGIVEEGEECDCGYESDCKDQCCYPKISTNPTSNNCKLKSLTSGGQPVHCSPSQGPCCESTCQFVSSSLNKTCRAGTECVQFASCDGSSASCPPAQNYPDVVTLCNGRSQVCENGVCSGSLCRRINYIKGQNSSWEQCFITASGSQTTEGLCYLACKKVSDNKCISSNDNNIEDQEFQDLLINLTGSVKKVNLPASSPCNDFKGYCDVFQRCRGIDNDGPLARLKNLIFSAKSLTLVKNWIEEHWWAVMLMAVGLILLMGLFIKVCAVHTPSSNPKAPPARSLTDTLTLRRKPRHRQQNYQQQPQGHNMQNYGNSQGASAFNEPPPPYSGPGPKRGHRDPKKGHQKV